ncbi:MAG TPA: ketose-bisphosphate aldolase [Pasteurellaceae bacterium]|nr:ketose-bisphosphate aldolase [Pasteurellaceae bacterium]
MLSDIRFWEKKASEGRYAIPHFNVWNAEMLMGVIDAAEELRAPIILSFGTGFTGNTSFEDFCYMMESMAKKASVPVILHWDHGRNMTILHNAVNHCMNSVMRDASALPFEENVAEVKRCVDYFHAHGIPVEAELGHVGNETVYEEALAEYQYTDPAKAKEFVERTGCDSLAIAIGNVHGVYSSEPKLTFDILEAVANEVDIPLVLHGASGISDEDIKKAISLGIAKINIHTELCQAAMEAVNEHKDKPFLAVQREVRDAIKKRAMYKIKLFGDNGRADE